MEVGHRPCDFVLDGDPAPLPPNFRPICETAGWIKMPLGTEVALGAGDIVLDGDSAPKKGHSPPIFGPYLSWPLGTEVALSLGDIVLDEDPASSPCPEGAQPPNFRPVCIVAKRLDGLRCHLVWR